MTNDWRTPIFGLLAVALFVAATVNEAAAQLFETKATQAFMIDAETGTVLFSKDADAAIQPASIAKLMTLELAFNAIKSGRLTREDTFVVSENAWRTGGAPSGTSTMFAAVKSAIRLEDLIRGIAVQSANDGCIVIAEGVAGSETNFALQMTERAREIGLAKSTFVNSTGLPAEGQVTTVRELVQLSHHLWREYPDLYRYFGEKDFSWNKISQRNRNPRRFQQLCRTGADLGGRRQRTERFRHRRLCQPRRQTGDRGNERLRVRSRTCRRGAQVARMGPAFV